jgi:hypothetical protein
VNIRQSKAFWFCAVFPTVLLLSWMGYETFKEVAAYDENRPNAQYNEQERVANKLKEKQTHDRVVTLPVTIK